MKRCKCSDFNKLIVRMGRVKAVQDWKFCMFCGRKMMEVEKK